MAISSQRIFITGAGIVSPLGIGCHANEAALRSNHANFTPVTRFDVSARFAKTAAQVDLPDEPLFLRLAKRRDALMDRGTKMLLLAIREAVSQAKMPGLQGIDAIIIGTSAGAMSIGQEYFREAISSPHRLPGQLSRAEFYQVQRQLRALTAEYDWSGPLLVVSNACASGANAVGDAMSMIRTGRARRVLAGGYDALAELVFAGFDTLRALAPSGIPRPFDAARDGLALGEGAAVMLLESEEAAAERGAEALACAAGYCTATDLHHLTQPDPEGKAAIRTMQGACQMASVQPSEITYINSHGTGTPYNDVAEASAVRQWAGEAASHIPLSSTKSAMGHLLGGAGAVEAVICLLAMRGQFLPGSLHVREADPSVCFDLVREARAASVKATLTNSFGFGGTNATLVFTPAEPLPTASPRQDHGSARPPLFVHGVGAVSTLGWGSQALYEGIVQHAEQAENARLPAQDCARTVGERQWPCPVRYVPPAPADALPKFPRLRRASPITRFIMSAGLEALKQASPTLGTDLAPRLGIIQCMFNGCVQFSGRFYHEVLTTPALASPLIFPETVYNAPASHLAAFLGADGPVTTLIGEASVIMEAVQMAEDWLRLGLADQVLVIGAEEADWVGSEAVHYYHPELISTEGAGALLLSLKPSSVQLQTLSTHTHPQNEDRSTALQEWLKPHFRAQKATWVSNLCGIPLLDACEKKATQQTQSSGMDSFHPRLCLGEGMGAGGALSLVFALQRAFQVPSSGPSLTFLCGSLNGNYLALTTTQATD